MLSTVSPTAAAQNTISGFSNAASNTSGTPARSESKNAYMPIAPPTTAVRAE